MISMELLIPRVKIPEIYTSRYEWREHLFHQLSVGWLCLVYFTERGKQKKLLVDGGNATRGAGAAKKERNNRTKRRKEWASLQGKKQRKAREEREASGEREMNNGVQKMHPKWKENAKGKEVVSTSVSRRVAFEPFDEFVQQNGPCHKKKQLLPLFLQLTLNYWLIWWEWLTKTFH